MQLQCSWIFRGNPETFKIELEADDVWKLYVDPEIKTYSSLKDLISDHNDSSRRPYLGDCVPPSEYGKLNF